MNVVNIDEKGVAGFRRDVVTDIAHKLTCSLVTRQAGTKHPRSPAEVFFYDELPYFKKLVSLKLVSGRLIDLSDDFWDTKPNLQDLTLSKCTVPADVLVNLINYFASLQHLVLSNSRIVWESNDNDSPVQSRPLQKSTFDNVYTTNDDLLVTLFQGMSCKEVTIGGFVAGSTTTPPLLIRSVENGVERLDMQLEICMFNSSVMGTLNKATVLL